MSSIYNPLEVPTSFSVDQQMFLRQLQADIKAAWEAGKQSERLDWRHVEPTRFNGGDLVLADGSDWDPGYGAGLYLRNEENTALYPVSGGWAALDPVATTSGTSVDFTIPSGAKEVAICLVGVSTSGTSAPMIQMGDAGGVENTNYLGSGGGVTHAGSGVVGNHSSGFIFHNFNAAANVIHGLVTLTLVTGTTWVASGGMGLSNATTVCVVGGSKTLSDTLTTVRLTTFGGADTFDAGVAAALFRR